MGTKVSKGDYVTKCLQEKENLASFLSDALYGNPWAGAYTKDEYKELINPDSQCREDKWADVLLGDGKLTITDCEEDEEFDIDLPKFAEALRKIREVEPEIYARVIKFDGSADMWDADCVLQYAVFGEWVYG